MPVHNADLLNTPELGLEVIRRLSLLQAMPTRGFAAGQAVTSIIDQVLGTGPCVINDIDVFMLTDDYAEATGGLVRLRGTDRQGLPRAVLRGALARKGSVNPRVAMREAQEWGPTRDVEGYDSVPVCAGTAGPAYTVEALHRDQLLNLVAVSFSACSATPNPARRLIGAFDINSTQVAVDLSNGALQYTPAFARFFATRELRIEHSVTPLQSFLRYRKKRKELQCFGNDDAHLLFTLAALNRAQFEEPFEAERRKAFSDGAKRLQCPAHWRTEELRYLGKGVNNTALAIGKKYHGQFEAAQELLSPWLSLQKHGKLDLWLPTLSAEAARESELSLHGISAEPVLQARRFWEIRLAPSKTVSHRRELFETFIRSLTTTEDRELCLDAYRTAGDAWLDGIENEGPMAELFPVVREHREVLSVVRHLTFGQQAQVVRQTRARMKRFDLRETWGVFRSLGTHDVQGLLSNPTYLDEHLWALTTMEGPLVPLTLPLPASLNGVQVKELNTNDELKAEGTRMSHCVGGYAVSVFKRRCRVISLRLEGSENPDDCATVEWVWSEHRSSSTQLGPLVVDCQQNRAFDNGKPLAVLVKAEEALRARLNAWLAQDVHRGWQLLDPKRHALELKGLELVAPAPVELEAVPA